MTRREDAATATVGLTGVAASAAAREHVLRSAYRQAGVTQRRKPPGMVMLRSLKHVPGKRKLRAAYLGSTALGLTAGVPAVTGATNLARRQPVAKVTQEERIRSFIGTGVKGSGEALRAKAGNVREPVPAKYRAGQAGVGLGVGALGAQATHAVLNRAGRLKGGRARAAATAVGATLTGAATLPATSAGINRVSHGKYRVTSTGVVRAKTPRKPASAKASLYQRGRPVPRGFEKRDPKTGYEDTPFRGRLARVYAAGAVPGPLGPVNAARQAGRMAPRSQQRSASVRQYAGSQGGKYAGAAAGGVALAAAAHRYPKIIQHSAAVQRQITRARHKVPGMKALDVQAGRGKGYVKSKLPKGSGEGRIARATKPLRGEHAPATAVGALAGSQIGGHTGTVSAYRYTYDKERRRGGAQASRGSRVGKADNTLPGLNRRETLRQIKRKQRNIVVGSASAASGLGALGLLGASTLPKVPKRVRGKLLAASGFAGTTSAGTGGVAGLDANRIARRDIAGLQRQLKVPASKAWVPRKGHLVAKPKLGTAGMSGQPGAVKRPQQDLADPAFRRRIERRQAQLRAQMRVGKAADPIKTYGDRGPLPKGLAREERMRAYAARVEHHGGRKGQKWQRRANAADATRNALVAGATGAGAILLTGRSKHVANVARKTPLLRRAVGNKGAHKHAETAALATGTAIGATELYGDYARHRRASYKSSPGGAAQSALTRMQRNTPGGAR